MRQFGLIGFPLDHSFSQRYFTEKFEQEGIDDCEYRSFPLSSLAQFDALLAEHPRLCGLNVTIPYKEQIIPHLHQLDAHAEKIGAVNTIVFDGDRRIGYNTDWIGFRDSLKPHLNHSIKKALVLGTGGSSKAVCYALEQTGIDYQLVGRMATEDIIAYPDLTPELIQQYQLIINCTPLGTFPDTDSYPPIPYESLAPHHLLFDLVYNPPVSRFLQFGKSRGAGIVNGHDMLIRQAEASWEIWNRYQP